MSPERGADVGDAHASPATHLNHAPGSGATERVMRQQHIQSRVLDKEGKV